MKYITEQQKDTLVIRQGMRFTHRVGNTYILSRVNNNHYALIDLASGNRWNDADSLEKVADQLNGDYFELSK